MSWLQLSTTNGRLVARRRLAAPLALIGSPLIAIGSGAVVICTLRRPPRTAVQAVNRLACGLCAAFLFAPSGRFGYFAEPIVLWLLPRLPAGRVPRPLPVFGSRRRRLPNQDIEFALPPAGAAIPAR